MLLPFPFCLCPPNNISGGTERERKEEWILKWQIPCHQRTLVIHSPPGSPRLKQSPQRYRWGDRGRREMAGAHPLRSFLTRRLPAPTLLTLASSYPPFLLVD